MRSAREVFSHGFEEQLPSPTVYGRAQLTNSLKFAQNQPKSDESPPEGRNTLDQGMRRGSVLTAESTGDEEDEWTDQLMNFSPDVEDQVLQQPVVRARAKESPPAPTHQKPRRRTFVANPNITLEARMRKVLDEAEAMGFDSFDGLAISYYTSTFSEGSDVRSAQSSSRSHRLRTLLSSLHESSETWVGREAQGYHDERIVSMEQRYGQELAELLRSQNFMTNEAEEKKREFIADTISQLFKDETTESMWRRDRKILMEKVGNRWYL